MRDYSMEIDPGDGESNRYWKTGTLHIEPEYDDPSFGHDAKASILNNERVVKELTDWYKQWQKPGITESGETIQRFMRLEMETRFPFLRGLK